MKKKRKHCGFSLMEVLLAVATLSIGMIFVAGVFPVAIYFSTEATEQTIAAVVADEAFAKIRLYGESDPAYQNWLSGEPLGGCVDFSDVVAVDPNEFAYPSYPNADILRTRYCWSALCRRLRGTRLVQVTVFVCRRITGGIGYRAPDDPISGRVPYPMPVPVGVSGRPGTDVLMIDDEDQRPFINDGYIIVDNESGRLYRVLRRDPEQTNTIILDRPWQGGDLVWVVPPPAGGGRYPCIAVYQKVIRF